MNPFGMGQTAGAVIGQVRVRVEDENGVREFDANVRAVSPEESKEGEAASSEDAE